MLNSPTHRFGTQKSSEHHQAHVDIAASGVRIRTHDVGLLDERLSLVPWHARERHTQLSFYAETSGNGPDTDGALDRGVRRDHNLVAIGNELHSRQKARRVTGGEELF